MYLQSSCLASARHFSRYNITTYVVAIGIAAAMYAANERFSMQRRWLKIITYCAARYRYHLRDSLVSLKNRVASRTSFLMAAGNQIGRERIVYER